ncbi:MAG: bifunctional riboflavin kinase/FAD synthetase [Alphaproteobacteria bacterium]
MTNTLDLHRDPDPASAHAQKAVVVIGNFDGVHKGHQAVIARGRAKADDLGVPLAVLVFEPHPVEFFKRNDAPFRLSPLDAKAHTLGHYGVDHLFVFTFNDAMAGRDPEGFAEEILHQRLQASHIVVGYDFRFGKGRAGDVELLKADGARLGFGVTVIEPQREEDLVDGVIYSSTKIRELLKEGKPDEAAKLLGHPWVVEGEVLHGDKRGRTIGFPTANISMGAYLEPRFGVYAVRMDVDGKTYNGVANIGRRPTFDKDDVTLEVHVFDFEGDLYGKNAAVSFIAFLRPEQKFDGLEALKAQIAADCDQARAILT